MQAKPLKPPIIRIQNQIRAFPQIQVQEPSKAREAQWEFIQKLTVAQI